MALIGDGCISAKANYPFQSRWWRLTARGSAFVFRHNKKNQTSSAYYEAAQDLYTKLHREESLQQYPCRMQVSQPPSKVLRESAYLAYQQRANNATATQEAAPDMAHLADLYNTYLDSLCNKSTGYRGKLCAECIRNGDADG